MAGRADAEGDSGEAGFVLLSVLLAAALFTAIAAGMAMRARLLAMQTANRAEAIGAQGLADGAALFAADALRPPRTVPLSEAVLIEAAMAGRAATAAPAGALPLPADGTPLACPLAGGDAMEVSAVDQGALLDLNGASVPMLRDVLAAAGLSSEEARRLADEIADFRDPDDEPQENGIGERAQYAARGLSWSPGNAPFADVEEIARLPSATPELVARLRPLFTTANPRPGLDLALAPRASGGRLPDGAASLSSLSRWQLASSRTDYAVETRLRRRDGSIAASRRVAVSFTGGRPGTLRILRWSRPLPEETDARAASARAEEPFCAALGRALGSALRR